ncbi:MAG TPA: DUF1345 domain-containing protein [Puia sp.]|jgi:uncharacterized membrane protein
MKFHNAIQRIHKIPARVRLLIGLATALIVFFLARRTPPGIHFILVWSSFCFAILVLLWITILSARPPEIKRIAGMEDSSRPVIFIFVLFASFISLFAVILLMRILPDSKSKAFPFHIGFAILSVILSWFLIHTIYAFRYTHLYYNLISDEKASQKDNKGGLIFPSDEPPDYFDFTYFSFVIGMTFQVSDIQITSKRIRRVVLLHALLSFAFNTAILALSINIISGLIQR